MEFSTSSNDRILAEYNGRLNLMEQPDPTVQFKMMERIAIRNKATEFRNPLEGIWEPNLLSQVFFSGENIQILQNALRAGVHRLSQSSFVIPPQNQDALKIIMRSVFLQNSRNAPDHIREQVEELNNLVLDYAIPHVYNESVAYVKYLRDQSTLVVPLERAMRSDREYKQLSTNPFI